MDEQLGRLIGNLLAGGGEIFLPGVGTLFTERQGARRLSKRLIQPPYRRVSFSSQERGRSLVDCIAEAAKCDEQTARGVYDRWITRAFVQDRLSVVGIGTLEFKHFTPTAEFDARLNPQGREPVRVKPVRRFDWVLWFGIAAIVGVLGFVTYWWLCERTVSMNPELGPAARTHVVVPAESADSEMNATVPDSEAAEELSDPVAAASDSVARSTAGDAAGTDPAGAAGTAAAGNASGAAAGDTGTSASAAGNTGASGAAAPATAEQPAALVSGRKYVVLGVFSTPENAARAVESVGAKNGAMRCGIYRFGGKLMVSPFESDDAEACTLFIRAHAGEFPDMWTYTAR